MATVRGKSIPGIVAIVSSSYTRNGKWSGTDYVLAVKTAIAIEVLQPFGGFGKTWKDHVWAINILNGEYDGEKAALSDLI